MLHWVLVSCLSINRIHRYQLISLGEEEPVMDISFFSLTSMAQKMTAKHLAIQLLLTIIH
jgi:hypothetical protein